MKKTLYILALTFSLFTNAAESKSIKPKVPSIKPYELWYDQQGSNQGITKVNKEGGGYDPDWENWSLPVGNGYLGACIFGRTDTERIQLTENSMYNKGSWGSGALTNFAELFIDFKHENTSNYKRSLSLNNAVSTVDYVSNGVKYSRSYFASYPDKVLVIRLEADKKNKLSFTLRPTIPYKKEFGAVPEGDGRKGTVNAVGNTVTLKGELEFFNIHYEGQFRVIPEGGFMKAINDENGDNGLLEVKDANAATILVSIGTNYKLDSQAFLETVNRKKLDGFPEAHDRLATVIAGASKKAYKTLLSNHIADYQSYFNRTSVDIGGVPSILPTDKLLAAYKTGKLDPYLEELFFQYGRYLLIASSRKGCLPANLQGIWNQNNKAQWNGGYYHNVNVEMNYWPAFNTNLAEMFESYVGYFNAYVKAGESEASRFLKLNCPHATYKADCGWTIGATTPYTSSKPGSHTGPGLNGLATKMSWDYYDFTRDKKVLADYTYPVLLGSAKFLTNTLKDTLGLRLVSPSASPEQKSLLTNTYYWTIGCGFDQQMTYENNKAVLAGAKKLGIETPYLAKLKSDLGKLDPIQIGLSGQIKEYREEHFYSEIGEPKHRHLSHLMGLMPGDLINDSTPVWLDAARITLEYRGDRSTGWGMAHRLNLWARIKDGEHAYTLYKTLLQKGVLNNLWDTHPPFQIDGNFGGTAGMAEMLLQSHDGYIIPLPALPAAWSKGSYNGLVARGNFECSVQWENSFCTKMMVHSRAGAVCKIKYFNIDLSTIKDATGNEIKYRKLAKDLIEFDTQKGAVYTISNLTYYKKTAASEKLIANKSVDGTSLELQWNKVENAVSYRIYRAIDSNPVYQLDKDGLETVNYKMDISSFDKKKNILLCLVAVDKTGREGERKTLNVEPR